MGNKHYSNFYIGQNGSKSYIYSNYNRVFARKGNCVILLPYEKAVYDMEDKSGNARRDGGRKMAVATEKIIPGVLPPKEETEGVDFLAILDSIDPSTLTDTQLQKFAPRNPSVTAYGSEERYYKVGGKTYPVPDSPIHERLHHGRFCVQIYRHDLEAAVTAWKSGSKNGYKNARAALIQAIGYKACAEYVQRIYDRMSEEELVVDQENWDRWSRYCDEKRAAEEALFDKDIDEMTEEEIEARFYRPDVPYGYTIDYDWRHDQKFIPIMSVKLQALRKAAGFTQRDFAKRIEYNINKYALLEQGKLGFTTIWEAFPLDLIKRIVDATYANPYWLEDYEEGSEWNVDPDQTAMSVEEAKFPDDQYPMFADARVIRYWWGHR